MRISVAAGSMRSACPDSEAFASSLRHFNEMMMRRMRGRPMSQNWRIRAETETPRMRFLHSGDFSDDGNQESGRGNFHRQL